MLETDRKGWFRVNPTTRITGLSSTALLLFPVKPREMEEARTPLPRGFSRFCPTSNDDHSIRSTSCTRPKPSISTFAIVSSVLSAMCSASSCTSPLKPHLCFASDSPQKSNHATKSCASALTEDLQMPSRYLRKPMQPCSPCYIDWTCALQGLSF